MIDFAERIYPSIRYTVFPVHSKLDDDELHSSY